MLIMAVLANPIRSASQGTDIAASKPPAPVAVALSIPYSSIERPFDRGVRDTKRNGDRRWWFARCDIGTLAGRTDWVG